MRHALLSDPREIGHALPLEPLQCLLDGWIGGDVDVQENVRLPATYDDDRLQHGNADTQLGRLALGLEAVDVDQAVSHDDILDIPHGLIAELLCSLWVILGDIRIVYLSPSGAGLIASSLDLGDDLPNIRPVQPWSSDVPIEIVHKLLIPRQCADCLVPCGVVQDIPNLVQQIVGLTTYVIEMWIVRLEILPEIVHDRVV